MPRALLEMCALHLGVLFHFLNTYLALSKHETAKRDGYVLSDVLELFVAKFLRTEAKQLRFGARDRLWQRKAITFKVFRFSILHETCFL